MQDLGVFRKAENDSASIKKPKKLQKLISIRFEEELLSELKALAKSRNVLYQRLIKKILQEAVVASKETDR